MKFRKKPVIIEATRWDGTLSGARYIENKFKNLKTRCMDYHEGRDECFYWKIDTLEDGHVVSAGDWIIRGVKGEFYPCKPDIFEMTYEQV